MIMLVKAEVYKQANSGLKFPLVLSKKSRPKTNSTGLI